MPVFVDDLVAIGATRQIVAVSTGTDDIPEVRNVPRVADYASVNAERIVALHPDVVVAIPAQMRFLVLLQRAGIDIEQLPDAHYNDIFSNLRKLGEIAGREQAASAEIASLQRQTARLRANVSHSSRVPSVFVVLGVQPIWTVGSDSYIATLIALAGGQNAAQLGSSDYGEYSAEALLRGQPDAIVTDPSTQLQSVLDKEPWRSLRAVQLHRVFVIPDASLLERPGPRYVKGLAWLIARLKSLEERS